MKGSGCGNIMKFQRLKKIFFFFYPAHPAVYDHAYPVEKLVRNAFGLASRLIDGPNLKSLFPNGK